MEETILNFVDQHGLVAVFVGLLLSGVGVPVPEDIYMIMGGMITQRKVEASGGSWVGPVTTAIFVLYIGVMIGDSVIYFLGRHFGERILAKPFVLRFVTPARAERVRLYYAKYGAATVSIARHTGPIRFVAFIMAGVSRMPFRKFFFWDSLAALTSVPLWFAIGYFFWQQRKELEKRLALVIAVLAAAALIALVIYVRRKRRRTPAAPPEALGASASPGGPPAHVD